MIKRLSLSIVVILCFNLVISSQTGLLSYHPSNHFKKYHTGTLTSKSQHLKSGKLNMTLSLHFSPLKNHKILLEQNDLISSSYKVSSPLKSNISIPQTMSGNIEGQEDSDARITISNGIVSGYIRLEKETYYIEPLRLALADKKHKREIKPQYIIYNSMDVITSDGSFCAGAEHQKRKSEISTQKLKSNSCKKFELAIALDYTYIQGYASPEKAIAKSMSIMNMVAGDYDDAFQSEIKFEIVEHFLSSCTSCDPWGSSTEIKVLIDDFGDWANSGFINTHDIGQLWSGKNLYLFDMGLEKYGVIGYAMTDAVCSDTRYHIMEDYSPIDWNLRVLTSHELGHNFGAAHDANGTSYIMTPNVNNTEQWSSASINVINNNLSNYTCSSSCHESCSEIVVIDSVQLQDYIIAEDTIKNASDLTINQNLTLQTPNVSIYSQFCVGSGVEFTIVSEGCQ